MDVSKYQVGNGVDPRGFRLWIVYHPRGNDLSSDELVTVIWGEGRHADETTLPPRQMLEHRPHIFHQRVVSGLDKATNTEQELPGWFERKCGEAGCNWFVPMVKRMAAGEDVSIEEIQATYVAHNGKPMPCGRWTDLFR